MRQSINYLLVLMVFGLFLNCSQKASGNKGNMKVGVSRIDITPPIGYPVHKVISTGVLDPLEVKTIVLTQGKTNAALISADLFYIPSNLSTLVRKLASEKTGIPISNICLTATHTHADPTCFNDVDVYISKMDEGKLTEQDEKGYAGQLINNLVQSVIEAQTNLKQVSIKASIIPVEGLFFNRRHLMKDGSVKMNGGFLNPDVIRTVGPVDPGVGFVLFNDEENGNPYTSLTTFAMQLATIGSTDKFSSGVPHFLEQKLQGSLGESFVSVFAEGTCADVNHWDITKPGPQSGYEHATKPIGEKIATNLLETIPELNKSNGSLAVSNKIIHVPLQTYSKMDLEWAKSYDETGASAIVKARIRKILSLEELRAKYGDTLSMEVQVFKLNEETAIVALPGQIFVELGLALKENSPFKNTLILTLANSHEECIPIRKAYAEGSYEIVYSLVESGSGEMLVETALSLLNEIK
ncbi:MAG: hypothetical protein PHI32_01505 [Dysgonamonadaceae bacterium]|nr:hypothetical protein [Dysgonamonadaceae bacterium]